MSFNYYKTFPLRICNFFRVFYPSFFQFFRPSNTAKEYISKRCNSFGAVLDKDKAHGLSLYRNQS